jgi:hypothetical protein
MSDMNKCQIDIDCWDGLQDCGWCIDPASLRDLDQALERLDSRKYTMVMILGEGEQHLTVGGGSGRYVVYATFDNEEFWNLLCADLKDGMVALNIGGQEGNYPARQVVDLEQARAAGRFFFERRQLDPAQHWERQ